jgi:hypothetical protein
MATASAHSFFAASASVAGALIGLLFVAISVAPERILGPDASEAHAVRAASTLTAFSNALAVSLFGLIPSFNAGSAAIAVSSVGLVFVLGAVLRLAPSRRSGAISLWELTYLIGLLAVLAIQLDAGIALSSHPSDRGALETICILVVVCFLFGIARSWDLVGGTKISLLRVLVARRHNDGPPNGGLGGE